jgi:hypothetical protein
VESAAGRRFCISVGILGSGAAGLTHGAGPSGHQCGSPHPEWASPTTTESGPTPIEPSFVNSGDKSPKTNGMVVDDDNGTSAESKCDLFRFAISRIALLSLLYLRYTDVLFNRTPRSVCDVC